MVFPTITRIIILSLGPILTLCMSYFTKWMKLLLRHILTILTSRKGSPIVALYSLRLSLTPLVLLRWTTVHSFITILSNPTKLTSVPRLATLNTPQSRCMPTRLNRRRKTRFLTPDYQGHLIHKTLYLLNHDLLKSQLNSIQPSFHSLNVRIHSRGR